MRKILNGKAYDTDTAEMIAEWESSGNWGNPIRWETLYRKKTGEFFLLINNPYMSGLTISPISEFEARMWIEDCANEKYEEIFGTQEE